MQWALLISGTFITLSVLGYAFYTTRDTRSLMRNLRASEKLATKLQRDLYDEQRRRWDETITLQDMLQRRDRELATIRGHVDELEGLIADAGGDVLAARRLRSELSKALAPADGDDDDELPDPGAS